MLVDYPNHLARYWLLLGGASHPSLASDYAVDWGRSSLVGGDMLALLLGQFVPYAIAGKMIVFLVLAGPPVGAACLSRLVFGRWHWWQLSFPLLTWSTTGLFGFLAFQISLALALVFVCVDILLPAGTAIKIVLRIFFGCIILFVHPFGLGFYALTLFAMIVGPEWQTLRDRSRQVSIVRNTSISVLPALILPVIGLLYFSFTLPVNNLKRSSLFSWEFQPILIFNRVFAPFLAYQRDVDLLFLAPLVALIGYSLYRRRIQTHAGLVVVGLFLFVVSVIAPTRVGDEPSAGVRFSIMAALLLFSGILPNPFGGYAARIAAAAAMFCLSFARLTYIDHIWQARQSDVLSLESALSHVPPGAKVFALEYEWSNPKAAPAGRFLVYDRAPWGTVFRHAPALVIPQRQGFIPSLFAIPGEQPVRFLPPWDRLAPFVFYQVPDAHVLDKPPSPQVVRNDPYLLDWDERFDYVVLIEADHDNAYGPFNPPPQLQLVSDNGYARLYRVRK